MRDVTTLKGIHVLRTMQSANNRSMPSTHGSSYLNLYILDKEKERLEKEDR